MPRSEQHFKSRLERPIWSRTRGITNRDPRRGASAEPSNSQPSVASRAAMAAVSVPPLPAISAGDPHHPAARRCVLHVRTRQRLCARSRTLQVSAPRRLSCPPRRGMLHIVVLDPAVQREAAAATISDEEMLRSCPPRGAPGGAPAGVGRLQQQRRPPTGVAAAVRLILEPVGPVGRAGTVGVGCGGA